MKTAPPCPPEPPNGTRLGQWNLRIGDKLITEIRALGAITQERETAVARRLLAEGVIRERQRLDLLQSGS